MIETLRVGLTGDVGAGKSTVRRWFAERGAATLDADHVVHRLLAHDRALQEAITLRFGSEVSTQDGVDRAVLASLVFGDPVALAALEALVFPVVKREIVSWMAAATANIVLVEAVKLVESGLHPSFDQIWLVTCDAAVRRERLRVRGWSPDEIRDRMASRAPLAPRLAVADIVIDNSGSLAATDRQLGRATVGCGNRHNANRSPRWTPEEAP